MWSLILFFSNIELHILQEKESTDLDLESSIFNTNNLYKPSSSKLNLKDGIRKSPLFDMIIVVIKFFILIKSSIKKEQLIFPFISLVVYFIMLQLLPIISLIDKSYEPSQYIRFSSKLFNFKIVPLRVEDVS